MQFKQVLIAFTAITYAQAANASNGSNGSGEEDSGANQVVGAGVIGAAAAAGVALLL